MLLHLKIPHFYLHLAAPDPCAEPIVVVDRHQQPAVVMDANPAALGRGVVPGAPEAEAFARCGEARFVALDGLVLERALPQMLEILEGFSPDIEV